MTMRIGESLKMDEYIRREDVIEWFMPYAHAGESIDADVVISDIKGMKAADVAPVRHGRWEKVAWWQHQNRYECNECSLCGCRVKPKFTYNYCPHCGAKMDGDG